MSSKEYIDIISILGGDENADQFKPGGQGHVSKSGASSGPLTQPSQLMTTMLMVMMMMMIIVTVM